MIRRDCDRYLRDAVADTLGSPDALDTSKFTVCLDYRKLPTTISIRSNPVKISSGHIDYELKRSHKEEGKTIYCAILRHGSGLKLETGCYYRTDPEWQHRNRAPPRWFSRAPMRIEVGDSSFDVPKNISDYLDHIIQNQASSFEEFWTLNLDESVHKWHLEVNGGMALFNRLAAACKPTRRGHWVSISSLLPLNTLTYRPALCTFFLLMARWMTWQSHEKKKCTCTVCRLQVIPNTLKLLCNSLFLGHLTSAS